MTLLAGVTINSGATIKENNPVDGAAQKNPAVFWLLIVKLDCVVRLAV